MNRFPKISIVTPNYNGAAFLEETIISIVSQNYPNLEYIIIDGGSTDGSVEIIKKHEKHLAYWISEPDSGMYGAIQKGFERSTGEIMAWLNSDDMYHPRSLFTVAEIFAEFEDVQWITGSNTNYDESGRTLFVREAYPHTRYEMFLNQHKHIQQESTFWTRKLWEDAGGRLETALKYAGDFELWVRFFRYSKLYRIDALIGGFRVRSGQLTQLHMDKYNKECQRVLENEKQFYSFYDFCTMQEIADLRLKLKTMNSKAEAQDQMEKIVFDFNRKQFILGDMMSHNTIRETMYKKHQNLNDFLAYIKRHHRFYPEVVIDVGVASGTFELYEAFPKSEILLVEPIKEFNEDLLRIQNRYESVSIFHCALGSYAGKININVHDDLMGSSLYNEEEGAFTDGTSREIEIKTLDEICQHNLHGTKSALLKIDVQGAELDVLEGAQNVLSNIEIIVLEVSLHKFFINGPEFYDVIDYMNKIGYVVYDIFGFLYRPLDGALAQVDMAFVKKDGIFKESKRFATSQQRKILKNGVLDGFDTQQENDDPMIAFQKKYNLLYEKTELLKALQQTYVLYGHATIGKTLYALMPESVIAFVDQKSDLMAEDIVKTGVYSPKNLANMDYDKIIICVLGREEEIEAYLCNELKVDKNRIIKLMV